MSIDQPTAAAGHRVPWNQLIAYGTGGLVAIALFNSVSILMGLLGNISLGLSAFWLGVIMIIPRLWDAFSDPVMGHLSDNTRTRWGRRRPYLLLGGIMVALSFVALWWVPRGEWIRELFPSKDALDAFQLIYILAGLLIFYTATTIFEIPHGALGMDLSDDYHERTRLFSAKSFLGNLFAMGTPWMFALASLDIFAGTGGDPIDGMRYVSLLVAAALVPMSLWWFAAIKEPGLAPEQQRHKTSFWRDMGTSISNGTFLHLVAIIFTLAMGFNFVQNFNNYITIFYLYHGNEDAAGPLLGVNGTTWAVTGLLGVFPLNWLSKRLGKNRTLMIAILMMCAAQLAKIVCYNPEYPYLVLIPTILLSAGMVMFFTLGAAMVGDICDEDELKTGARTEGSYYGVYWWFIKLGFAFAAFVMGWLVVRSGFDEQQNVTVNDLQRNLALIQSQTQTSQRSGRVAVDADELDQRLARILEDSEILQKHFPERLVEFPAENDHIEHLIEVNSRIRSEVSALQAASADQKTNPEFLRRAANSLLARTTELKQQTPATLFRMRLFEIGVPLVLSSVSLLLTLRYPLTEARWREIKAALDQRHAAHEP
jgi:glycoside/pentoside/hexuronide:cation symporter, GPH family